MDFTLLIGYVLAILVGVSLGLVGSGGSILTVPILVYVFKIDAVTATGYSLFIVGVTALVGGVRNTRLGNVQWPMVWLFGLPSLVVAFLTRAFLIPSLPDAFTLTEDVRLSKSLALLILFAIIMFVAALKMIRPTLSEPDVASSPVKLAFTGAAVGLVAGAVGAGGGFLIIPSLVFLAGLPMKKAVGTSLVIIAIQSLAGFVGELSAQPINWSLLAGFSAASVAGIFVGIYASGRIDGGKLKTGFGWFVLLMAVYILAREIPSALNL